MKLCNIFVMCLTFAASCCASSSNHEPGKTETPVVQGDYLPFSMVDMNTAGKTMYNTKDHDGAVFVLEYYGNFCGACNENAPNVDVLAEEMKSRPEVQVLDVSIDQDDSEYAEWIENHHPSYPVLADKSRSQSKKLKIKFIPTVSVIDCNGNLVHQYTGIWGSQAQKNLRQAIETAATACKKS